VLSESLKKEIDTIVKVKSQVIFYIIVNIVMTREKFEEWKLGKIKRMVKGLTLNITKRWTLFIIIYIVEYINLTIDVILSWIWTNSFQHFKRRIVERCHHSEDTTISHKNNKII